MVVIDENETLLEGVRLIEQKNISFIPIVCEKNIYKGFIKKSSLFWIFKAKLYNYLNKPILDYYNYLKDKNLITQSYEKNLFFTANDNLFEVFRKFIYTSG